MTEGKKTTIITVACVIIALVLVLTGIFLAHVKMLFPNGYNYDADAASVAERSRVLRVAADYDHASYS